MKIWGRLKAIPEGLCGFVIVVWVLGLLAIAASLFLEWGDEIQSTELPAEFLPYGRGLVLGAGVGMIFLGTIIYMGWAWVRHALMVGIAAIGLSSFWSAEYERVPASILIAVTSIALALGTHYFYFRKDVVAYFNKNKSTRNPDGLPNP